MKVYIETIGCVRNSVDSEIMAGRLESAGHLVIDDPEDAEAIVVNTCGFVTSAVEESIDYIIELAQHKKTGRCRRFIIAGCRAERYKESLVDEFPEADFFMGTGCYHDIVSIIEGKKKESKIFLFPDPHDCILHDSKTPRIITTGHIAYLKIAEGCDRHCTYCIIPRLRGKQRSREIRDIVHEAESMISSGVKEIILVAQDTTFYGRDLESGADLNRLLSEISSIDSSVWLRVLYGNPDTLDTGILETIRSRENICHYFDLPIQHASDRVLKRMGRRYTNEFLSGLFKKIRSEIPDAALRTTVITGFPGETDEDLKILLDFIEATKFDHLGAFTYSDAEDIPSHRLPDHVPEETASSRFDRIMAVQAQISYDNCKKYMNRTLDVMIDDENPNEEGLYQGHTKFPTPDADGVTFVDGENLKPGDIVKIKITDTFDYDLIGDRI
jgi:ribosomal protein S12 methylthiotransferase